METKYAYKPELETAIEKLNDAMLCVVNWTSHTVTFEPAALEFFATLNVEFSKKVYDLLKVGESLGIITAEQVADWKTRRAEYENFLGEKFQEAKLAGKNEIEARKFAQAAWEVRALIGEPTEVETARIAQAAAFAAIRAAADDENVDTYFAAAAAAGRIIYRDLVARADAGDVDAQTELDAANTPSVVH